MRSIRSDYLATISSKGLGYLSFEARVPVEIVFEVGTLKSMVISPNGPLAESKLKAGFSEEGRLDLALSNSASVPPARLQVHH